MRPVSMRTPLKLLTLAGCVALLILWSVLPIVGWLCLLLALHMLVSEFETGRAWVRGARRRSPLVDRWIVRACEHRWAPSRIHKLEVMTKPSV